MKGWSYLFDWIATYMALEIAISGGVVQRIAAAAWFMIVFKFQRDNDA